MLLPPPCCHLHCAAPCRTVHSHAERTMELFGFVNNDVTITAQRRTVAAAHLSGSLNPHS
jgi:hypothetical protein